MIVEVSSLSADKQDAIQELSDKIRMWDGVARDLTRAQDQLTEVQARAAAARAGIESVLAFFGITTGSVTSFSATFSGETVLEIRINE